MDLNLEEERRELKRMEHWFQAEANTLPIQRKLVSALEQLEQAREALREIAAKSFDTGAREYAKQALKQQEVG